MKLSTLIELANLLKIRKAELKESYKPLNEAFTASLFLKYYNQFKEGYYNNKLLSNGNWDIKKESKLGDILLDDVYRYISSYLPIFKKVEERTNEYYEQIKYKSYGVRKLDSSEYLPAFLNMLDLIIEDVNELYTPAGNKNIIYAVNDTFNTNYHTYEECIEYIDEIIRKYNTSFVEELRKIPHFLVTKFSNIDNSQILRITPKEARSNNHKYSFIFWEDIEGKLLAISYEHSIVLFVHNSSAAKNKKYIMNYSKQPEHPFEFVNNINHYATDNKHTISNIIQREIVNYVANEYTDIRRSIDVITDTQKIKDILSTLSTTIFTDNGKRTAASLNEIGAIYAINFDNMRLHNMKVELDYRRQNKEYYELEGERLAEVKKRRQQLVADAKKAKEYIGLVKNTEMATDYFFKLLPLLYDYLKIHVADEWLTLYYDNNGDSSKLHVINNYMSIINELISSLNQGISISLELLNCIATFERFADVAVIKKDYSEYIDIRIELSQIVSEYNSCFRSILNNNVLYDTYKHMVLDEPELFKGMEQLKLKEFQYLK